MFTYRIKIKNGLRRDYREYTILKLRLTNVIKEVYEHVRGLSL